MRLSVIISNILSCLSVGKLMWKRYSMIVFCICTWSFSKDIFHFQDEKHIHWFCLSNICFVSSKKWRNFASESISLSHCFLLNHVLQRLEYCFTTYSFSKIHRHISTCIHDWRFKDNEDNVKLNQFEKEINIDCVQLDTHWEC